MNKKTSGNPLITTIFTADPSAHTWEKDSRIYIYASHDIDPARGADFMDKYHVYSSADMVNWQDEGEILSSDDVPWGRPEGGFMWAPDCAYKDGTYYFYYPHPSETKWNNTWKIGVATSDRPDSGFVDRGYLEGAGGFAMIDPAVFVDDDGRAYFYYGGGGSHPLAGCFAAELNSDMMSFKTKLKKVWGLRDFHEAAWVFKREDWYYLIYSDNKNPGNRYRYAMSQGPLGPWKHKGIFLDPVGCETTHGSITEFKGEWYLFYHNQAISGQGNLRSVCCDKVRFNDDGTIKKVIQTKEGVPLVGDPVITNHPQVTYSVSGCALSGGALKAEINGETVVLGLNQKGAVCEFSNLDGGTGGRAEIRFNYSLVEDLAKLRLYVNGKDESLINLLSSGGIDKYSDDAFITVPFKAGKTNSVGLAQAEGAPHIRGISVKLLDISPEGV